MGDQGQMSRREELRGSFVAVRTTGPQRVSPVAAHSAAIERVAEHRQLTPEEKIATLSGGQDGTAPSQTEVCDAWPLFG
jgi:hypothetical protein